ncbi:ORF68 [Felid gammaherpesvirus 1]|uniref:Packaging protein UL32 n=1 Tax=Felid gammaherpesvirus 1 TaxID=2560468 RepID=A0A0M4M493_9GAMA|nr:ORF68 [Felis catus gammaherpesvirus 1]ALE14784.1 ORF68 [Felis catus gammaherpesvirus 1]
MEGCYRPWNVNTILKHSVALQTLLQNSYQPGEPETALNSPVLTGTYNSLSNSSSCKVCQIIYSLISKYNPSISFYEDYACLCFYTLYAPKSWSATFMVAADLLELFDKHFSQWEDFKALYTPGSILGIDLNLHFFIQKCFRKIKTDAILDFANLNFLKVEFLRGCLVGSIPHIFCFKSTWNASRTICSTCINPASTSLHQNIDKVFNNPQLTPKCSFLSIILNIWSQSTLLSEQHKQLTDKGLNLWSKAPNDGDVSQGPCLLSHSLQLKIQGCTSSICLLCECLASHSDAALTLQFLKEDIITSAENNIKLIDRIIFLLKDETSMKYITDNLLLQVIRGCSPQEIHKHLFCDPRCLVNTISTSSNILFKIPSDSQLQKLKATLALGIHLDSNNIFDCENLDTLITLFKCIQICKVGKTTFLEIIKHLNSALKKHNILTVHAFNTSQIYV